MTGRMILFIGVVLLLLGASPAFSVDRDSEFSRAQELESRGRTAEARLIYEKLYAEDPSGIHFWKLILFYEQAGDFAAMQQIALDRLKSHPGDLSVLDYLARAYNGGGDREKARKVLLDDLGDRWNDADRVRNAAGAFQSWNDFDGALMVLRRAREKTGQRDAYSAEIARVLVGRMEYAGAVSEYLKTLESSPGAYVNIESIIRRNSGDRARLSELVTPLAGYCKAHPKSLKAAKLLAGVQIALGDDMAAFRTVFDMASATGNPDEAWAFARRLDSEGRQMAALSAYEEFRRRFPANPEARTAIARTAALRMETGDRAGAMKDYSALIGDYPGTPDAELAALRLIQLSEDSGIDITERLRSLAGSTTDRAVAFEARFLLGERCLRGGDPEEAHRALSDALLVADDGKEKSGTLALLALLHFFTGDYDAMTQDIDAGVSDSPGGGDSNDLLSLRVLFLRASEGGDGGDFDGYARARYALYRGIAGAADSLAVVAADTVSVVAPAAAMTLGDHYRDGKAAPRALGWYTRAASSSGDTTTRVEAIMAAADVQATELGNPDAARKLYVEALTAYPGTVFDAELRTRLRRIVEK